MKKQKSYFFVLPKNGDVLFASWKIDPEEAHSKISQSVTNDVDLFLEVNSIQNKELTKIDSIHVHGLENNWHIFTKKQYRGKRLVFSLCFSSKRGRIIELITSKGIDLPLTYSQIEQTKKTTSEDLFKLSQINITGSTGSGKNSSW